jgi:hypothetical protein
MSTPCCNGRRTKERPCRKELLENSKARKSKLMILELLVDSGPGTWTSRGQGWRGIPGEFNEGKRLSAMATVRGAGENRGGNGFENAQTTNDCNYSFLIVGLPARAGFAANDQVAKPCRLWDILHMFYRSHRRGLEPSPFLLTDHHRKKPRATKPSSSCRAGPLGRRPL